MNNQFEIKERSPLNNCYVIVPHNFNILEEQFENSEHSFQEYLEKLRNFLQSFYFMNEAFAQLHLSLLHLALRKIPRGKILFLIGDRGDDKEQLHQLVRAQHATHLHGSTLFAGFIA